MTSSCIDDVIDDAIVVGGSKVNMLWNPLTKPINLRYQLPEMVNNSISSDFFSNSDDVI